MGHPLGPAGWGKDLFGHLSLNFESHIESEKVRYEEAEAPFRSLSLSYEGQESLANLQETDILSRLSLSLSSS